jgi:hypothetical protein
MIRRALPGDTDASLADGHCHIWRLLLFADRTQTRAVVKPFDFDDFADD